MMTTLQKFYQEKVVLLTGASGFLGKMLLLKLLLSCPGIKGIIVLLRRKNGMNCSDRLSNMLSSTVFAAVPSESLLKVSCVQADIMQPGLGLSSEDHALLLRSNVSVVFHIAATVKFNEQVNVAVKTNVMPLFTILQLCEQMPQMKVLVHVSTASSQFPHKETGEEVYLLHMDPKQIVETNSLDGENGQRIGSGGEWPNTYVFSKALAEDVIQQNSKLLPVAIFRPGIVTNALKEPKPGWIDNISGITRVLSAVYLGNIRSCLFASKAIACLVPVDMCVNALIAVAWETAMYGHRGHKVYNFALDIQNPITWGQYWTYCGPKIIQYPSSHFLVITRFFPVYVILWFCLELVPASLAQVLNCITSGPQKNIRLALASLKYTMITKDFTQRDWLFRNTNLRTLLAKLKPEDRDIFNFDLKQLNWNEYLESCVKGVREHILKEELTTLPFARKRYRMLYALHCALQICLAYLCYRVVWYFAFAL